jgi:hypothetical protein
MWFNNCIKWITVCLSEWILVRKKEPSLYINGSVAQYKIGKSMDLCGHPRVHEHSTIEQKFFFTLFLTIVIVILATWWQWEWNLMLYDNHLIHIPWRYYPTIIFDNLIVLSMASESITVQFSRVRHNQQIIASNDPHCVIVNEFIRNERTKSIQQWESGPV